MNIVNTIVPIFVIILIGAAARRQRFITPEFIGPANRLAFYIAIPAMIFRSISKASLKQQFNLSVLVITLGSVGILFGAALIIGKLLRVRREQFGTWLQSSIHGNLGYIGLAVAYYFLGNDGFVRAGILAGFVMILQNTLAVLALRMFSGQDIGGLKSRSRGNLSEMILDILKNPTMLSSAAGILFSLLSIPIPSVIGRSLDILSSLALPLALLVIGASLSFDLMKLTIAPVLWSTTIKLVLLPGAGLILYRLFNIPSSEYLSGMILLAAPTATVTYVMAKEMNGDGDFAVAAISICTMLSAVTYSIWLYGC